MDDRDTESLRREAERLYQQMVRLEKDLETAAPIDRPWTEAVRRDVDRIFAEMGRVARPYSRVWAIGPVRKYLCLCCGLHTLDEESPGSYDICPVCGWEDDPVQFDDPTFRGGANHESLSEAQALFRLREIIDRG